MTKQEYLQQLSKRLPPEEREERLAFYSEMIDDRMEEGMSEAEAVASMDPVEDTLVEKAPPKRRLSAGEITLLCLGSPLWVPLLIAAVSVVLSLYVSLWAVIVSLWAVFGSLVACAAAGVIGGIGFAIAGHVLSGLALLGAGLVSGGLSIVLFYGCHWATKGTVLLTKKLVTRIFRRRWLR